MFPGRIAAGHARAVRAIVTLTAASACLGAVAYAATRPGDSALGLAESKPVNVAPRHGASAPPGKGAEALLRPRFIEYPEAVSAVAEAQFRFHVPPRSQPPLQTSPGGPSGGVTSTRHFQCGLNGGGWRACSSPHRLDGLAPGSHVFAVRAFNRAGRPGPAVSYSWRQAEPSPEQDQVDPQPFSIELRSPPDDLHPGFLPQQLPILISNPNAVPIEVTSLTIAIDSDSPVCSAENFALTGSNVSPTAPLIVPAGDSVSLPTATVSAPTIGMLDLPVNQDACQGANIPLVFSGEAHG
ncbi:MAG: hypothetical protein WA687_06975 [Solirubrobacterales bacterium]